MIARPAAAFSLVGLCLLAAACSSASTPKAALPYGPPPEYEDPREFNLPGAKPPEPDPNGPRFHELEEER